MQQFRPFWNKVWESPALDAAAASGAKKLLWELDVNAKYIGADRRRDQNANGLMETKLLARQARRRERRRRASRAG